MILNETVRDFFQPLLNASGEYMIPSMKGKIVQIYRGKPRQFWRDDHKDDRPGGCLRHKTVFNQFGIIPRYCFECYKIEILPRNVVELFKLLMVFEKISLPNDNTRKCMVEGRPESSGAYKGFVYCRGLNEGKEVRRVLKQAVSNSISPSVPVILKRGCSEYASSQPSYAQIEPGKARLEYKKKWRIQESIIDQKVRFPAIEQEINNSGIYLPEEIYSMQYWLRYAATIGDASYQMISGMPLEAIAQLKREYVFTSQK